MEKIRDNAKLCCWAWKLRGSNPNYVVFATPIMVAIKEKYSSKFLYLFWKSFNANFVTRAKNYPAFNLSKPLVSSMPYICDRMFATTITLWVLREPFRHVNLPFGMNHELTNSHLANLSWGDILPELGMSSLGWLVPPSLDSGWEEIGTCEIYLEEVIEK